MMTRLPFGAAALALSLALAAPATAAPVAASPQAESHALILAPLSFVRVSDLDFGTIVSSPTAGTVTINPFTGARTTTGGVTALGSAPFGRATFAGAGSPGQLVTIAFTPPTELTDAVSGQTIPVAFMTLDGLPVRVIDPVARTFFVSIGGVISIGANQADGDYAANLDITADYQ